MLKENESSRAQVMVYFRLNLLLSLVTINDTEKHVWRERIEKNRTNERRRRKKKEKWTRNKQFTWFKWKCKVARTKLYSIIERLPFIHSFFSYTWSLSLFTEFNWLTWYRLTFFLSLSLLQEQCEDEEEKKKSETRTMKFGERSHEEKTKTRKWKWKEWKPLVKRMVNLSCTWNSKREVKGFLFDPTNKIKEKRRCNQISTHSISDSWIFFYYF